jgi:hypothetical protein
MTSDEIKNIKIHGEFYQGTRIPEEGILRIVFLREIAFQLALQNEMKVSQWYEDHQRGPAINKQTGKPRLGV